MTQLALVDSGAEFSADRVHRYRLWRRWADGPMLMVIGLNPSTADETTDDPTVRRCIGYAERWGFAGLLMTNLFAYRSTDPRGLLAATDPVGPGNWHTIANLAGDTLSTDGAVLAAWGAHGRLLAASKRMDDRLVGFPVACLGRTRRGEPKHPLYLRADATPEPYLGDGGLLCRR